MLNPYFNLYGVMCQHFHVITQNAFALALTHHAIRSKIPFRLPLNSVIRQGSLRNFTPSLKVYLNNDDGN